MVLRTRRPTTRRAASANASPWAADRARYGTRPFLRDWSIYAVAVYRFGRWNDTRSTGRVGRRLTGLGYLIAHRLVEALLGITLPKEAEFGPGLRIHHLGPVVVHPATRAGANCTLRHGVTIGERRQGAGVPVLGDDVEVGAYAQLLGPITIGRSAKIGAMSLVIRDVPEGATVRAPEATVS
jgi:serine O-acetyltransferase